MSEFSKSDSSVVDLVWMKLWFDSDLEASETVGLKLVKEEVRCVVWNMATTLGFQTNGVPGNACRLLERYFYTWFKSYSQFPSGVRTPHLAAGAVVVVARLERSHSQNSALTKSERNSIAARKVGHLARLVNIPFSYLTCLSDVIIAAIKQEYLQRKSKPLILKRKMID